MTKIIVFGSTHGHEKIGLKVIEELRKLNIDSNNLEFVVGNPKASEKNIPFVESDLNRVFPGKEHGTYEDHRALELSRKILDADVVIDVHSTKTTDLSDQSMIIVTKFDDATKNILKLFNPPKVLHMKYKGNKALISQAKIGIAFEYGKDDSELVLQATLHDIAEILVNFNYIEVNPYKNPRQKNESEFFEVYDAYKKEFVGDYELGGGISNFVLCKTDSVVCYTQEGEIIKAPEDFYPILFGNNRYTNILGFKARKMMW